MGGRVSEPVNEPAGEPEPEPVGGPAAKTGPRARPDHGPAAREIDRPVPRQGRLERAIAELVRRLRRAHGLTLTDAAARTGISVAMLSKIENASISCSLTTLDRIADACSTARWSTATATPATPCAPVMPCGSTAKASTDRER
jgi:ribosome-binding protein aMBF1 (putative translation factor)